MLPSAAGWQAPRARADDIQRQATQSGYRLVASGQATRADVQSHARRRDAKPRRHWERERKRVTQCAKYR
jgi:hypothetical protein